LVGTWGEKIKKPIINLPKIATINVHPSLLPKYRGPNPYLEAIRHMEKRSGITFHLMDESFDTGAILLQKEVKIEPNDTGAELRRKITFLAREGICELLKELNEEIIIPVNQDESKSSYFSQIKSDEVMLDFSKSAEEVSAHIRGFHPWAKCFFPYNNHFFIPNPYKLEILENDKELTNNGSVVDKSHKEKSVTVLCGDGKLLKMDGLELYGILGLLTKLYIKYRVKKFNNLTVP